MKWIGAHIWDWVSRFRNDVYLEDVTESTQSHIVGIDSDGKLYKQDPPTVPATTKYVHLPPVSYMYYLWYINYYDRYYSPSGYAQQLANAGTAITANITTSNQAQHAGYVAPRACKLKSISATFYMWSNYFGSTGGHTNIPLEFEIIKWTPGDGSTSSVTPAVMTATDHDGNYLEFRIYNKKWVVTDDANSTLAAGDAFNIFCKCTTQGIVQTGGSAGDTTNTTQILMRGEMTYEIELT
tara:strand:- start:5614 stop:6330 length:717 start_codon:yes stop_codon:yes gene_type:complete